MQAAAHNVHEYVSHATTSYYLRRVRSAPDMKEGYTYHGYTYHGYTYHGCTYHGYTYHGCTYLLTYLLPT